jgi:hypothetical protein
MFAKEKVKVFMGDGPPFFQKAEYENFARTFGFLKRQRRKNSKSELYVFVNGIQRENPYRAQDLSQI